MGISWLALFLTGRVHSLIQSGSPPTVKEDALAALLIISLTTPLTLATIFIPVLRGFQVVFYWLLLRYAYPLKDWSDLSFFYAIHVVINGVIFYCGLIPLFMYSSH